MANELQLKYRSPITAQASAAIPAGTISTGALTLLTNTPEGNCGGCMAYQCYVKVTVSPSSPATARLYYTGGYYDLTFATFDKGSLSVEIPKFSNGIEIPLGIIYDPDKYSYVKLGAEDYEFGASLIVVPILAEAQ